LYKRDEGIDDIFSILVNANFRMEPTDTWRHTA